MEFFIFLLFLFFSDRPTQYFSQFATRTIVTSNGALSLYSLYSKNAPVVPDYLRITFTRFRLCSHRLRVELGRWSRTPHEERICMCGEGVQDDFHIFQCPLTEDIFSSDETSFNSPEAIFKETSVDELQILHRALERLDAENDERT